ncbi:MAG: glycogen synthase GlgA [Deltaproteobacteria bacterium]
MALNVVFVSSEIIPFAKTGGLADVAGSLPLALKKLGCNVTLFMPLYREVREKKLMGESTGKHIPVMVGRREVVCELYKSELEGIPVYFLRKDEYFDRSYLYSMPEGDYFDNLDRFVCFSKGVLESLLALGIKPDVIHVNDWQSSLIPAYIKGVYGYHFADTATLLTIHNIAYQGLFDKEFFDLTGLPPEFYGVDGLEFWDKMSLLKGGIIYSDMVTTVSQGYSKEIQTPEYGYGLEGVLSKRSDVLHGILNGVDYGVWNPKTDKFLAANYDSKSLKAKAVCKKDLLKEYSLNLPENSPLIGIISRLADQKGFDILSKAMEELMALDIGIIVLGTGEKKYHELFIELAKRYPKKLGVKIAFDNALSHKIEAGCDMFLMPSRYEPCGLNQIYSLRYGTIPIVRATGGLDDTIKDYNKGEGNGFKFVEYSEDALVAKVKEAVTVYSDKKAWQTLQKKAMSEDFSWDVSAGKYVELYELAIKKASKS